MKIHFPGSLFIAVTTTIVCFNITAVFAQDTPNYIPPSCTGQPLIKMTREEMLAKTKHASKPNPPIDHQHQVNMFEDLVDIINENYLYPDFNGLNWNTVVIEFRKKVSSGLGTEEFYKTMEEFIKRLGDKHSYFESPVKGAAIKAQLAGETNFVGVGALFQPMAERKYVTVLAVMSNSPAQHAGLQQHDIVLEVDGLPLIVNDTLYMHTRGPACSKATLLVRSPGKEPREMTIVRAAASGGMPVYARLIPTPDGRRIGYIFLPTFLDLTIPGQIKKALEDFGPLDGLVLDNRMNRGGSSQAFIPVLSYFSGGKLGHFISRDSQRVLEITPLPVHNSQQVPLVVLVSKNTVSYGEVFAGILQDQGRAKIVGQATKGSVETLWGYHFENGASVWLAKERFDPIKSHISWQGKGVQPDIVSHKDWDEFTFENDPALAVALKFISKK